MDKKSDNKIDKAIDKAIDEVLESKRLKQGAGLIFKTALGLGILFVALVIIGVAAGIIK